ncbi:hypothetical protein AB0H83_19560 [Dactylosporangium sp. NPDC050688]|uniref:hypothetical protein n=1 Tax=Dactylosporangium sp. NPDC050688 TaxID=3157217 RepID=UPI00340685A0
MRRTRSRSIAARTELDGRLLQASAQAEALLSALLSIESRLAQAKRGAREVGGDAAQYGSGNAGE